MAFKFNSGQNNSVNIVFADTATGCIASIDDIDLVTAVNYKGQLSTTASDSFTWNPSGGWKVGNGTAQLVSTENSSILTGEQAVAPNTKYTLSFSGKSTTNGISIKVEDSTTGLVYQDTQFNSAGTNQFTNYVIPFTTSDSATGIRVTLSDGGGGGTHTFMAFNLATNDDSVVIGNAGFEASTLEPWQLTDSTTQIVTDSITANARSGSGSLKFIGNSIVDKHTATQTISVSPNSTYSFSFWMKASAANVVAPKVNVFGQDGTTPLISTFSPANAGTSYTTSNFLINTGSNTEIQLQFVNNTTNARNVFLDDLTINQLDYSAIPTEPQTVLENGDYYAGAYNLLNKAWTASNADIYLDSTRFLDGKYSLRMDYDNAKGASSLEKTFAPKDLSSSEGIQLWLASETADGILQLTLKNSANQLQIFNFPIKGSTGLQYGRFAADFDSSAVTSIKFNVIGGSSSQGTLYVDAVKAGSPYSIENGKGTSGWAIIPPIISGKQASAAISTVVDATYAGYGENTSSLKITYAYNTGNPCVAKDYRTFAEINKSIDRADWSKRDGLQFWISPDDATQTTLTALIYLTNGNYAEASYALNSLGAQLVTLPFSDFTVYPTGEPFNPHGVLVKTVGLRFSDSTGTALATTNKVVHVDQLSAVSTSLLNLKAIPGDSKVGFKFDEPDFLGYSGIDIDVIKDGEVVRTMNVIPGAGMASIAELDNRTEYTFTFNVLSGDTIVGSATVKSIPGSTATVTVAPDKLIAGAPFTTRLSLNNLNDKSYAQRFEINYNPSAVSYLGTTSLQENVALVAESNDPDNGVISVTLAVYEGISGVTDLLDVNFASTAELSEPVFDSSIGVNAWLSYDENNPLDDSNFQRISGIEGTVSILMDNSALKTLHDVALNQYNNATPGYNYGTYPIDAMVAFATAIGTAGLIADSETSTRSEIQGATDALQNAIDAFRASINSYVDYVPTAPASEPVTIGSDGKGNITVTPKLDSEGKATAELDTVLLTEAFQKTVPNIKGVKTVVVNIPKTSGASSYEQTLSTSFVTGIDSSKSIEVKTEIGSVTLQSNLLNSVIAGNAKNITMKISNGNKTKLNNTIQAQVGKRPMIEIALSLDGKPVTKSSIGSFVTVSVPYTPTVDELINPEFISVKSIGGSGDAIAVPSGKYDPISGTVTFKTTQFDPFVIISVKKTFSDIQPVAWAKKEIEVLATKGIINGVNETSFDPNANITRADFLVLLVKTLDLQAEFDVNFSDVKANDYYYEALGIAKVLGISAGTKNGLFDPNAKITRQDAMVLVAKALRLSGDLEPSGDPTDLKSMTDKDQVSAYAIDDAAALVKAGLIQGSGGKLNPLSESTRAEIAMIMYKIYNK
ncbi:MAG: S-layer homology domain-containing protein, partial [Gorillibacterium sp.]|nr:S-layer homology domain-containing protein [Gorillibacterium sp.]